MCVCFVGIAEGLGNSTTPVHRFKKQKHPTGNKSNIICCIELTNYGRAVFSCLGDGRRNVFFSSSHFNYCVGLSI
jgi:hypothetical protein